MRIAVVSDVHSNLAALRAVIEHSEKRHGLDAVWSLGDVVGYGPQPNEVIALLRSQSLVGVVGNHDLAVAGLMDTSEFNPDAAAAAAWNAAHLDPESALFLQSLHEVETLAAERSVLCHGSLREPVWEYMITEEAARAQFQRMQTPYSFVGHTHIPLVIEEAGGDGLLAYQPADGETVSLHGRRLILNPGGVGQPRDGDPRAAYAVLDTGEETMEFYRVPYPIRETQTIMAAAGLPARLIRRLQEGR